MATITLQGNPIHTVGDLPANGSKAPDFTLVNGKMQDVSLKDFAGKRKLLNIFPSVDTGVCAASVRKFNEAAASVDNAVLLMISADLPMAQARACTAEGLDNVVPLSTLRGNFGEAYGVKVADGPTAGLMSRAVVVLDENDQVVYTQQVPEISQEPDYDAALAALKG